MQAFSIRCALSLALTVPSIASQIVVDANNGPGTHFTDIPPAVAAAQPGDVIVVRPGGYSAFTVDRRLTVVGQGIVTVNGTLAFANLAAGQRAAVVNVLPSDVVVSNCQAPVILQDIASTRTARITSSSDVRVRSVHVQPPPGTTTEAMLVEGSRLEAVSSTFHGSVGCNGTNCPSASDQHGGSGILVRAGARAHVALSDAIGGQGSWSIGGLPFFYGGDGGPGAVVEGGELVLAGGGSARVIGGYAGLNLHYSHCLYDGGGGFGIANFPPGSLVYSGTTIEGQPTFYGSNCVELQAIPIAGSGQQMIEAPVGPTLGLAGTTSAGASVVYTLKGVPGGLATWWFGRAAILAADPGIRIERLANAARTVALGVLPASGELQFAIQIPSGAPLGALLCTQAEVLDPATGTIQRTNSVPIVVR